MLDVLSFSSTSARSVSVGRERDTATTSAPPVIVGETAQDETVFPPSIFGKLPACFDLARTEIHALGFWLRKAMAFVDNLPTFPEPEADNEAMAQGMDTVMRIFEAIKGLSPNTPSGAALQLKAISEFVDWHYRSIDSETYNGPIEEISADEFRHLATNLGAAVRSDDPTKLVGPLTKGRKLTRAGLLHRYHAFLVGELETLSWNLYGSRDYAMQYRPRDSAVSARVTNRYGDGPNVDRRKTYPFFDESRLSIRARTVLGSLDIDTERDEDATRKQG
jgi:hypothetical protein